MRTLLFGLATLLPAVATAGEPLLVPDFTPASTSEFSLAFLLQDRVIASLEGAGHVVLTSDVVRPRVGAVVDACADTPACPTEPLRALPARVAVVVRVERRDAALIGLVAIWGRDATAPVDTRTAVIVEGKEQAFADLVVTAVDGVLADVGPGPAGDLVEAARLVDAARQPKAKPPPVELPPAVIPPVNPPVVLPVAPPLGPPADPLLARLSGTELKPRHFVGVRDAFLKTDKPPLEWIARNTPHAGRLTIEVRGGLGIGDVDRQADVRVAFESQGADAVQVSDWLQEGPAAPTQRMNGALFLGYSPTSYLDFGLIAGLQYGRRSLTTGWTLDGDAGSDSTAEGQAAFLVLEPLVRLYLVPTGIVKPYLYLGFDFRAFDRYKVVDPSTVDYPDPPAGSLFGPVGGGGLLVDPGPVVGFFVEGSYVRHFGGRAIPGELVNPAGAGLPNDRPIAPPGTQQTIQVTGGVQFRL